MIVNAIRESDIEARFYPDDMDTNPATASAIAENGFFIAFDSLEAASQAQNVLASQNHIQSYELTEIEKNAPTAADAGPAPLPKRPVPLQMAAPPRPMRLQTQKKQRPRLHPAPLQKLRLAPSLLIRR